MTANETASATLKHTLLAGVLQKFDLAIEETLLHLYVILSTDGVQNLAVKMVVYCGDSEW